MAHFAKLDDNNIVIDIIRISNNDLIDEFGVESESIGLRVVREFTGYNNWVQCSYNRSFRKNYPQVDYIYDNVLDAFYSSKTHESFIFDESECLWIPPIEEPENGEWEWSFDNNKWEELG